MRVAIHTTFAASRKEPLVEVAGRVRQAFLGAGLPEPVIRFTLFDSPAGVSSVDRVLKRYPAMERFVTRKAPVPSSPGVRLFTNAETGEAADYDTLAAILAGVPRSYPFRGIVIHFHGSVFGELVSSVPTIGHSQPGVIVTDSWWVNGRQRSLSAYTVVEVEDSHGKLPPNPAVDAVIQACGKVRRTVKAPLPAAGAGATPAIPPAKAEAVKAIVADYRARMREVMEQAGLPHNLPPAAEIRMRNLGVVAGPRKPALEAAFKPMGYQCRGGSGEFHLNRRTAGNLAVELYLDVGTWSHTVTAIFLVQGAGFKASLAIPVSQDLALAQYPIGDAAQWQRIVGNLAAMVRELDRSFVPEIEQAAGPSPEWYQPAG